MPEEAVPEITPPDTYVEMMAAYYVGRLLEETGADEIRFNQEGVGMKDRLVRILYRREDGSQLHSLNRLASKKAGATFRLHHERMPDAEG